MLAPLRSVGDPLRTASEADTAYTHPVTPCGKSEKAEGDGARMARLSVYGALQAVYGLFGFGRGIVRT